MLHTDLMRVFGCLVFPNQGFVKHQEFYTGVVHKMDRTVSAHSFKLETNEYRF